MAVLPAYALSVRQPWAWAIIHAAKDIENRSWKPGNRGLGFTGPVAVHASKGMTRDEYDDAAHFMKTIGVECPPARDLQRGGIVGTVEITGITRDSASPWFFGPIGLCLSNAQPVDFIPSVGALGFFKWARADASTVPDPARWMLEGAG